MDQAVQGIQVTRARLFVLIDSFERDIRGLLTRYVLMDLDEREALGPNYEKAAARRDRDLGAGDEAVLVNYLDLREAYDLLNSHRRLFPEELAREVRELTGELDRLVPIRNRVMHGRPLGMGDLDGAYSILTQFRTQWWRNLDGTLRTLISQPDWEPVFEIRPPDRQVLNNLPLPEYDDTGLIGRSREVEDLLGLLKKRREPILTVTGEGGIGKTALALEVCYRLVDDPDEPFEAILWTSLKYERLTAGGIEQIADATRDIAGAIVPLGRTFDREFSGSVDDIAQALDGIKALVVIDNLETIASSDFTAMYDKLPSDLTFLITSRVGLGELERRYPLSSLRQQDSMHLLNDFIRSRHLESLKRISGETRKRIVESLRNNPLAIRWFVLAVEAGNDPVALLRGQTYLIDFCVRSVYDSLDADARGVLTALSVLGRGVSPDHLVVLLDLDIDRINRSLQQLYRGSLIRRETATVATELSTIVSLTETARAFIDRLPHQNSAIKEEIARRDRRYRETEERRIADESERSLAPVVVRARGPQDVPTAHILRNALLAAKRREFDRALELVGQARRLNPDFWEVDRVEGFIRAGSRDHGAATMAYQRAYERAEDEGRAVVSHFLAGHLARNLKNPREAIPFAREAHQFFASVDTAVQLGNYLVWTGQYEEGIELIEGIVPNSSGKARLIAVTALAGAYRRFAEYARAAEHNPARQFARAVRGYTIATALISTGAADERLRDIALECASEALDGAAGCLASSQTPKGLVEWIDNLQQVLARLRDSSRWEYLARAVQRLASIRSAPSAVVRLGSAVEALENAAPTKVSGGSVVEGTILSLHPRYGFIRHSDFPSNLFFHFSDVAAGIDPTSLAVGGRVCFVVDDSDPDRPRALSVSPT